MDFKDINRVLENYDKALAEANRKVILLSSKNEELLLEVEDLKNKLKEKEDSIV